MSLKNNSRLVAGEIIERWLKDMRNFPDRMVRDVEKDRAFVSEVVYGIVRRHLTLRWFIGKYISKTPPYFVEALLYVGAYQLLFMDNVEVYAAVNETVEAAKRDRQGYMAKGFINSVLHNIADDREMFLRKLSHLDFDLRFSHPAFALRRWQRRFGEAMTINLCEWNNTPPETILRLNERKLSPRQFEEASRQAGIEMKDHPYRNNSKYYIVPRGINITTLPGFSEGWFTIQDPGAALAVDLLDPLPGETVLDACAAPGGKSVAIYDLMEGEGDLTAMDIHDDRMKLLNSTLARTGCERVRVLQNDARRKATREERGRYDAILMDVPCTNTGVLRRRADARWRFRLDRMKELNTVQYAILDSCSERLKPGGRMVYSTCSLEDEENEKLIMKWLRKHPNFKFVRSRKCFPPKTQTDGSYAGLLRREK